MPDNLGIDYELVEEVSGGLGREVERVKQIWQALKRRSEVLRAGAWGGAGAQAFYREMENQILPAFSRLEKSLAAAGQTTRLVAEIFRQAELEAAGYIRLSGREQGAGGMGQTGGAPAAAGGAGALARPAALAEEVVVSIGEGLAFILWWPSQNLRGLTNGEARKKVEDILNESEAGRAAIQRAKELGVKFALSNTAPGSCYDPATNTMYIDPNLHPQVAADVYIHELTHAEQRPLWPDAQILPLEDYVTKCLYKEADATIAEFRYEKQNFLLDALSAPPYEKAYWDAYQQKYAKLERYQPPLPGAYVEREANAAGREKLLEFYRTGALVTSTTHQPYTAFYRNDWADKNAPELVPLVPPKLP